MLSIVIPVFNEEKTIVKNMQKLSEKLAEDGLEARLVLVDDGSQDNTWEVISAYAKERLGITCLRFSRNFGKEAAILAGIKAVKTERCLVMDSDLQHPPRYIRRFMDTMDETGADIVEGVKSDRGRESWLSRLFASLFYKIFHVMSGIDMERSSDFKLINRRVMDAMSQYQESRVFFRGLVQWGGFVHVELPFAVEEREGDTSKFSLKKLVRLATDSIISFTSKPLYLTIVIGIVFFFITVVLGIQTLFNFFTGRAVSGFTTVILLNLFIGFLVLTSLGIIGIYIARIYNEVKKRPQYLISERAEFDGEENGKNEL